MNTKISLQESTYNSLKQLILSEELCIGELHSEKMVCDRLKVSRTPVRAALQRLESEEIVVILPQRGFYVYQLNEKDIDEIFELRKALEGYSVTAISASKKAFTLDQLKMFLIAQKKAAKDKDAFAFMESDSKFHETIILATGNNRLISQYKSVRELIASIGFKVIKQYRHFNQLLNEHEAVVDALEGGDAYTAMEKLWYHLDTGADLFKQLISSKN